MKSGFLKWTLLTIILAMFGLGIAISGWFQAKFLIAFEFTPIVAIAVMLFFEAGKIYLEVFTTRFPHVWRVVAVVTIIALISANVFSLWMYRTWHMEGELIKWENSQDAVVETDAGIGNRQEIIDRQIETKLRQLEDVNGQIEQQLAIISEIQNDWAARNVQRDANETIERLQSDRREIQQSLDRLNAQAFELAQEKEFNLVESKEMSEVPIVQVVAINLAVEPEEALSLLSLVLAIVLESLIWLLSITIGSLLFGKPRIDFSLKFHGPSSPPRTPTPPNRPSPRRFRRMEKPDRQSETGYQIHEKEALRERRPQIDINSADFGAEIEFPKQNEIRESDELTTEGLSDEVDEVIGLDDSPLEAEKQLRKAGENWQDWLDEQDFEEPVVEQADYEEEMVIDESMDSERSQTAVRELLDKLRKFKADGSSRDHKEIGKTVHRAITGYTPYTLTDFADLYSLSHTHLRSALAGEKEMSDTALNATIKLLEDALGEVK